jgi:uncharacterized RDD family membrane protein YckC
VGGEPLDAVHRVETPEGVRLALRPAGPVARALAWSIDFSVRGFAYAALALILLPLLGVLGVAFWVLCLFLGEWGYPVFFEVLRGGQTPGKQAVGIRVVNDDGTPVGWSSSILRNLLLAADLLPGTYLAALVSMLASRDFRRLGDLAAGTLVVHVGAAGAPESGVPDDVVPQAPPFALEVDEQRAVISYALRAALLSPERAEELAALATPLHGREPARERLVRIAAWLLGRRADAARAEAMR